MTTPIHANHVIDATREIDQDILEIVRNRKPLDSNFVAPQPTQEAVAHTISVLTLWAAHGWD